MKKFNIFLIGLVGLFFSASCSEDLLDIPNPNQLTTADFWKSEADVKSGVNAIYTMFYKIGSWNRWIFFRYDLTGDEGYSHSPWIELADWTRFQYSNYNFWDGNNIMWRDHYKAIWRCNQVITYGGAIEMDPDVKESMLAEAYFLRAFYFYNLEIMYGEFPLVLTPSNPDDYPVKNTYAEIWAQIEGDINTALKNLPDNRPDNEVGRPTKWAAKGLLARAYMQQHKYDQAKAIFEEIINSNKFKLVDRFGDNFQHTTENNSESLFEIQFSDASNGGDGDGVNQQMGNNVGQFFAPAPTGWQDGSARTWVRWQFYQEKTIDGQIDPRYDRSICGIYDPSFEKYDVYPGTGIEKRVNWYGEPGNWDINFDPKDCIPVKEKAKTYMIYGKSMYDRYYTNDVDFYRFVKNECWIRKFSNYYWRDFEDYFSPINFRWLRYADVLLLYAECIYKSDLPKAVSTVDMVRHRANLPKMAESQDATIREAATNADKFFQRLIIERSLELCYESVRWADLKRWGLEEGGGTAQTLVDQLKKRDLDFNNFVVGKHHRMPVPTNEIDNNKNLTQHPEY